MNKMIQAALLGLFATSLAHAEPSSQVAWTPDKLNFVKKGNSKNGKELAMQCAACHGDNGVSSAPEFPSLAGQLATYTYKQLQDYKNGQRAHPLMTSIAAGLSDQDMADMAAWYSSLPPPRNKAGKKDLDIAERLVFEGDGRRTLPPCYTCHGSSGQGEKMDIPALAGQQAEYFTATLTAYRNGERHNDIYSRMRVLSQQLSDTEIQELAQYYQQLQ
ncbi:MAG: cytochrome c4 [Methylobacter sp.]|uniref:c-type cytochrome n=1 Tax=Methylobacter sp. TaxID=2051955 RepID=UPI0025902956|nr:c-type cytochrome [Methylobacter sp.]MCL7420632.1 cytochrome c4 [Methylobacter sp.]